MDKKIEIEVLVHIHSIPEWLVEHLQDVDSEYYIWASDYQRLVDGANLWRVWMIDEYGSYWIEVNYVNEIGEPEFHTLKLEEGTFSFVEFDAYDVISEQG